MHERTAFGKRTVNPIAAPSASRNEPTDDDRTRAAVIHLNEDARTPPAADRATAAHRRAMLDSLLDPYIVVEAVRGGDSLARDFRIVEVNLAAAEHFPSDRSELVGRRISECAPSGITEKLIEFCATAAELHEPVVRDNVRITTAQTGVDRFFDVRASRDGEAVMVTWRDVSIRNAALHAYARSDHQMWTVLDSIPDPILLIDRDLTIKYVNRAAVDATGIPMERWIGHTWRDLGFPDHLVARYEERTRHVFATGEPLEEEIDVERAQPARSYETRYVPVLDAAGRVDHVLSISRDESQRRVAELQLFERATHDPLTGLANRAELGDEIERAMESGRRSQEHTAVLMVDLDNFKHVNDSLGHAVGDRLLVAAAERLRTLARDGEMVARFSGDEFVIVMRALDDPTEAARAAQQIVDAFRQPIAIDGVDVYTTASVGIAAAGVDSTADDLIREADTALFASKAQGRDRIAIFNTELRAAVTDRLTVEAQLRPALERDELVVWYQPEVDMVTGTITAVEALLRWNHPERGLLTADRFIDVAEETGLVLEIGSWVLHTACADAARWNRAHPDRTITVRVNLSARQITERSVLSAIDVALEDSGLPPEFLCVEITETALLRNSARVVDHLRAIRTRGVRIALDDFGTGYASLSYLREYPVDVLKIDRSFVMDITEADFDARLVGGVIALADVLEVDVTAEGVETPEQADLLIALGCERAQGFLYSRAVPAERIEEMLG